MIPVGRPQYFECVISAADSSGMGYAPSPIEVNNWKSQKEDTPIYAPAIATGQTLAILDFAVSDSVAEVMYGRHCGGDLLGLSFGVNGAPLQSPNSE